jgi:hypothetical protein
MKKEKVKPHTPDFPPNKPLRAALSASTLRARARSGVDANPVTDGLRDHMPSQPTSIRTNTTRCQQTADV